MRDHAALIAPKFETVDRVLREELGADGAYATWTTPEGGAHSMTSERRPSSTRP